tara:strand:+ start:1062 stop:1955 length:894 start_codon:yes stop_codon:yes gene_type:complete
MGISISIDNKYIYKNLSKASNPKGIVHICHGMAEHIGRYNWLIKKLNDDGYHVISIDHRGHGNRIGDNPKGFFDEQDGWNLVVEDLSALINQSKHDYPHLKQFLIAHSMGSWIALSALQNNIGIDGLILSGSSRPAKFIILIQKMLIKIQILFFGKKSVSIFLDNITLGSYNNFFKPNRTKKDWISSDDENVDNYVNDLLCGFPVTNGLWDDLANGILKVFNNNNYSLSDNTMPIFIISGSKDPVGENGKGVMRLYNFLSNIFSNVSIKIVDEARHEVFSETSKENSYNTLIKFIET